MTWVNIGGRSYYRRSARVGGRVVTEHVGRGPLAELQAELDADVRRLRRMADAKDRDAARAFAAGVAGVRAVDRLLADLAGVLLHAAGCYRHRRQWRRHRGASVMGMGSTRRLIRQLTARLDDPRRPPLLAPDLSAVPDADRAVLAKASAGDEAALEAAGKYLDDPAVCRRWGNPARAARA